MRLHPDVPREMARSGEFATISLLTFALCVYSQAMDDTPDSVAFRLMSHQTRCFRETAPVGQYLRGLVFVLHGTGDMSVGFKVTQKGRSTPLLTRTGVSHEKFSLAPHTGSTTHRLDDRGNSIEYRLCIFHMDQLSRNDSNSYRNIMVTLQVDAAHEDSNARHKDPYSKFALKSDIEGIGMVLRKARRHVIEITTEVDHIQEREAVTSQAADKLAKRTAQCGALACLFTMLLGYVQYRKFVADVQSRTRRGARSFT